MPGEEVRQAPAWRQAVDGARLRGVHQVRKLRAVADKEYLQRRLSNRCPMALKSLPLQLSDCLWTGCCSAACAHGSHIVGSTSSFDKNTVSRWMRGWAAWAGADREVVANEVPDAPLLGPSLGRPSVELDSEAAWVPYPLRAAVM